MERVDVKRRLKRRRINSMWFIMFVMVVMFAVLGCSTSVAYAKNKAYQVQEQELEAELEEEKGRTEEIQVFREYVQTDEYVESVAKDKLNMAYPEEIIFVPMD